jgi:pimeloyl-ACP methyl ester carboxylesterase
MLVHSHAFVKYTIALDFDAAGFTANYHVRALDQRGHSDSAWAQPPDYSYARYAADVADVADVAEVVEQLDFRVRPAGTTAAPEILRYLAERSGRQVADGLWRHKFDRNVYSKRVLLDLPPHWNRIGIPALLVKGGRSDRITPAIVADAKSRCPQVELVEVPGADHHVTLDNPGGFADAVNAWLGPRRL